MYAKHKIIGMCMWMADVANFKTLQHHFSLFKLKIKETSRQATMVHGYTVYTIQ